MLSVLQEYYIQTTNDNKKMICEAVHGMCSLYDMEYKKCLHLTLPYQAFLTLLHVGMTLESLKIIRKCAQENAKTHQVCM